MRWKSLSSLSLSRHSSFAARMLRQRRRRGHMREELDQAVSELEAIDAELKSKSELSFISGLVLLKFIIVRRIIYAEYSQTLTPMEMAPAATNSEPSTSIWLDFQRPVLR
jgi:hypothetical protein